MGHVERASLLFIAASIAVAGLYYLRDILTPFVLAIFVWLIMDGFARALRSRLSFLSYPVALMIVILFLLGVLFFAGGLIAGSVSDFINHLPDYQTRLDHTIQSFYERFMGEQNAPKLEQFFSQINVNSLVGQVASLVQGLSSNLALVLIYVAFLFVAQASHTHKLDAIFQNPDTREKARTTGNRIKHAIEQYLWVQTLVSMLTAVLSYASMKVIGLDNALFWAFVIFILNYLPTIGSVIATLLPTLFALVQFSDWRFAVVTFIGIGFWQFLIGNALQPRLMGKSLNLSVIVILLGLALWGALWGSVGMFLSAPLTVMLMIVLAQFPETRWVSILLSGDGHPEPEQNLHEEK